VESRYERERAFHDRENERWKAVSKFYRVTTTSHAFYEDLLYASCPGRRVLEYGCGDGSYAFALAERGARVTGIDISDERIRRAREAALVQGEEDLRFEVMNAEALGFEDDSFDLVCGTSILHHLDLERALPQLVRTLTPGGEGVFLEPLGHNPAINLYRRVTPAFRTPDEHPLRMSDLRLAERYFEEVDARFFHLTSLLSVPLGNRRSFARWSRALERLDQALFARMPSLRRYAWVTVLSLARPRKRADGDGERLDEREVGAVIAQGPHGGERERDSGSVLDPCLSSVW
jgi:ubiquinone/menaquinone biosynthesis C-methylase UbiE